MKTYLTLILSLLTLASFSQESLPYYTGFNNQQEQSGWKQYRLGDTLNTFYQWEMNGSELLHNYPVGGTQETDDWMVSPSIDFSNGAIIDSLRFKAGGFGMPFGVDTVAMYLVKGDQNPGLASSLTLLELFTDSSYNNNNIWKTYYNYSISAFSDSGYIAFRYKTVVNWLDVSFDDLYIKSMPVSVNEIDADDLDVIVYPNPTSQNLYIKSTDVLKDVQLFDIQGKLIRQFDPNTLELNVNDLTHGVYLLRIDLGEKTEVLKVIIE